MSLPLLSDQASAKTCRPHQAVATGVAAKGLEWHSSASLSDAACDEFLRSTPLGHFQQTSLWSQVKATEGWHILREMMLIGGEIVGGFQILYRPSRFGRVGYLSKGPV